MYLGGKYMLGYIYGSVKPKLDDTKHTKYEGYSLIRTPWKKMLVKDCIYYHNQGSLGHHFGIIL